MRKKYVSTRSLGGHRDTVGIGYIIIPRDADKKLYVQSCLRTGTISIALDNGGIIDNVLITRQSIGDLEFPENYDTLGSLVVWVSQARKQAPIIIGVLSKNNQFVNFNRESNSLRRENKEFVGEVVVDAHKKVIIINSISSKDDGGDIYIISLNKQKNSKLNINISGDINIKSTNFNLENSKKLSLTIKDKDVDEEITTISYEKGVGLSYLDEFKNEIIINDEKINLKPNKRLDIGEGEEPMMLGDTFKSIFDDFTDALSKMATYCAAIQVGTAMGPSTVPTNAAQFTQIATDLAQLKAQYETFQSKQSFLD